MSGPRIQVLYALPAGAPDRYGALPPVLTGEARAVDDTLLASATQTGGDLQARWLTRPDCTLDIGRVTISAAAEQHFETMETELATDGFNRTDRKYLVLVDTPLKNYCGVARSMDDDKPVQNANDGRYSQMARVNARCWAFPTLSVSAHELVHTLGAVQRSAPHSTAYDHCTDGADLMCYVDGPGTVLTATCPAENGPYMDCGHDDYFSTSPPPGSYLATHWNTARSSFLSVPAPPTLTGPAQVTAPRGGAFTLTASPQVPSGQVSVVTWALPGCSLPAPHAPSTTATCPAGVAPPPAATATVRQADGQSATWKVNIVDAPPLPAPARIALALKVPARTTWQQHVLYGVTATGPNGPVAGVRVAFTFVPAGSSAAQLLGHLVTDPSGRAVMAVTTTRSGTVRAVVTASPSHTSAAAVTATTVVYGTTGKLTSELRASRGQLVRPVLTVLRQDGRPAAGMLATLSYRRAGSSAWVRVGTAWTSASGRAGFVLRIPSTVVLRATAAGTSTLLGSVSEQRTVIGV